VVIKCTVFIEFHNHDRTYLRTVNPANPIVFMRVGYVIKLNQLKHKYKASFIMCVKEGANIIPSLNT
jgi:hypothetical protein